MFVYSPIFLISSLLIVVNVSSVSPAAEKISYDYLISRSAAICLLIGMLPESPIDTSLGFKNRVKFIVGPTFSGICMILWLVALLKGKFKHQNEK